MHIGFTRKGKGKNTKYICQICLLGDVSRLCGEVNKKPVWGPIDISKCRTAVIVGIIDEVSSEIVTHLLNYN